jgi:hypothetical protein
MPTPSRIATSSAPERTISTGELALGGRLRRNGATSGTPTSPGPPTAQVAQKPSRGTVPESTSTEVPTVALTVMASRAPSTMMAAASRKRSSSIRKPALLRRVAAVSGANVLPAAMKAAPSGEGPMGRLTARAPRNTAGQTLRPNTSMATRAIPVGGQIGVTWP